MNNIHFLVFMNYFLLLSFLNKIQSTKLNEFRYLESTNNNYFNSSQKILDYFNKNNCTSLLNNYNNNKNFYRVYEIMDNKTIDKLKDFFLINNKTHAEIKNYINALLIEDSQTSQTDPQIKFFNFIGEYMLLFTFFSVTIVISIVFYSCACYDYCPICCKISKKNIPIWKTFSVAINAFFAINLIVPCILSFSRFKYINNL